DLNGWHGPRLNDNGPRIGPRPGSLAGTAAPPEEDRRQASRGRQAGDDDPPGPPPSPRRIGQPLGDAPTQAGRYLVRPQRGEFRFQWVKSLTHGSTPRPTARAAWPGRTGSGTPRYWARSAGPRRPGGTTGRPRSS